MLPLKYVQKNPALVKTILEKWDHDAEALEEIFQTFRVSANIVCSFQHDGKTCWLRFAPEQEKGERNWYAETAFLQYLRKNGFPCAKPIPSKQGNLIESVPSEFGSYLAVVFEQASGSRLDCVEPTETLLRNMGALVGKLHRLSMAYVPEEKPWSCSSVLGWCMQELNKLENQEEAVWEASQLSEQLGLIRRSKENYGMIHFGLVPENLFLTDGGRLTVIDFEDCMLNWYVCDLDKAASSLERWLQAYENPIDPLDARMAFLNGYRTENKTPGRMWAYLPLFRRFSRLYRYTRLVRAVAEPIPEEPPEISELRGRLEAEAAEIAMCFRPADLLQEEGKV